MVLVYAYSRIETSANYASMLLVAASLMFAILFAGCGGGEDFSKPPVQIQNQLANVSANPNASTDTAPISADTATPATDPAIANADNPDQVGMADPATEAAGSVTSVSISPTSAGVATAAVVATKPAVASSPDAAASAADNGITNAEAPGIETPAPPATPDTAAASGDGSEVMTASGKSAAAIAAKKEANSANSVMGNAGGLLGSLKSGANKSDTAAAANPASGPDAAQPITRFGRMALSRVQWLQLVSQLTRVSVQQHHN